MRNCENDTSTAPLETVPPVVEKLVAGMQKAAAQNPTLIERWRSYGGDLKAQTSEGFAAFMKQDDALWGLAIRKAGVKLD